MRERWFSRRALTLHLAVVLWVPGCLVAGWWQVTRALDGNGLSYLYSVEWPVFALVGIWMWWSLIHTDPETVGARAQRRLASARARAGMLRRGARAAPRGGGRRARRLQRPAGPTGRRRAAEDLADPAVTGRGGGR